MFWKKNDPSILIEYHCDSRRCAYRLHPRSHTPVVLFVAGERVQICNISSTGVSFSLEGGAPLIISNDYYVQSVLVFEGKRKQSIPLLLQILEERDAVYRCSLKTLSDKGQKVLCHYLVKHQKREIRLQRQIAERSPV